VAQWLDMYNKSSLEQEELLVCVGKGLNLYGPRPEGPAEALVEVNIKNVDGCGMVMWVWSTWLHVVPI